MYKQSAKVVSCLQFNTCNWIGDQQCTVMPLVGFLYAFHAKLE